MDYEQAKLWLQQPDLVSIIRTTEMIAAIEAGMGIKPLQSADQVALHPGDEALLTTLSFGVLLAWAEGQIVPLAEDWRCALLTVAEARPLYRARSGRLPGRRFLVGRACLSARDNDSQLRKL